MAILSEVVKQQIGEKDSKSFPILTQIADSARDLVGSMRDIVWSTDPRHDDLQNLVSRIRQFGSDVLEAKGIKWEFQVPAHLEKVRLEPDQRRHLFLILKEAINNSARHSDCKAVALCLNLERQTLKAELRDDGSGFSLAQARSSGNAKQGQGLHGMELRAVELGANLIIETAAGVGTKIILTVPLRSR